MWKLSNNVSLCIDFEGILFDTARWYKSDIVFRLLSRQQPKFPIQETWEMAHQDLVQTPTGSDDTVTISKKAFLAMTREVKRQGFRTDDPSRSFSRKLDGIKLLTEHSRRNPKGIITVLSSLPDPVLLLFKELFFVKSREDKQPDYLNQLLSFFGSFEDLPVVRNSRVILRFKNSSEFDLDRNWVYVTTNLKNALMFLDERPLLFTGPPPRAIVVDPEEKLEDSKEIANLKITNESKASRLMLVRKISDIEFEN
ncbi:MAG TPA: hypothetical protein PKA63_13720 [Oligoflexia bacterium]|nr:hypothetical protein [Oligoflexia bacterium]HMP49721.1 hypothetical protein [Oligoflexia bacterium]